MCPLPSIFVKQITSHYFRVHAQQSRFVELGNSLVIFAPQRYLFRRLRLSVAPPTRSL
jgi:hypothetical protein